MNLKTILKFLTLLIGCLCQYGRTGMFNGQVLLSPSKYWYFDITARYIPDIVHIYIDKNDGQCQSEWACDAPCGVDFGSNGIMAASQDCGHNKTIQGLANEIYGVSPYFAVGN